MLDITSYVQSSTTFRRRSGDFMKQIRKTRRPVILTVKGKAAAVVQDPQLIIGCWTSQRALTPKKAFVRG